MAPYNNIDEIIEAINFIKAVDLKKFPDDELEVLLSRLINDTYIFGPKKLLLTNYRLVRVEDSLVSNLERILAPSPPHSKYGRCNLKDAKIYYAAKNLETALLECKATKGDQFHVVELSAFESSEYVMSLFIGQYDEYRRTRFATYPVFEINKTYQKEITNLIEKIGDEKFLQFAYIDAFIAEEFRKKILDDNDYKITATISKLFFEAGIVDQIIYPSVTYRNSLNLAIKPSLIGEKYKINRIFSIKVRDYLDYGMFAYEEYAFGRIGGEGDIIWNEIPNRKINLTF